MTQDTLMYVLAGICVMILLYLMANTKQFEFLKLLVDGEFWWGMARDYCEARKQGCMRRKDVMKKMRGKSIEEYMKRNPGIKEEVRDDAQ